MQYSFNSKFQKFFQEYFECPGHEDPLDYKSCCDGRCCPENDSSFLISKVLTTSCIVVTVTTIIVLTLCILHCCGFKCRGYKDTDSDAGTENSYIQGYNVF